jgi:hypothetical protein
MGKTIRKTSRLVINQILAFCNSGIKTVLEPSAGSGDLVEGIIDFYKDIEVDCIELNNELRRVLKQKGYNVVGEDFMQFNSSKLYDCVIAAPTYKNNVDVDHIMKMYEHVKPGGFVVSLTSPYWTVRNNKNQIEFRKWLEDKDYQMRMLPDMSFVENYETHPSMLIKINKPDR